MTTLSIEMERTYYLDLDGVEAYVDVFIDGSKIRMDKVRFFDFDPITDEKRVAYLRHKWPRKKIIKKIKEKYDFTGKVRTGLWTDTDDGKIYDIHTVVSLKDGFENYVLARDLDTWHFILLDVERVTDE